MAQDIQPPTLEQYFPGYNNVHPNLLFKNLRAPEWTSQLSA